MNLHVTLSKPKSPIEDHAARRWVTMPDGSLRVEAADGSVSLYANGAWLKVRAEPDQPGAVIESVTRR
jgi:hypothetical protein